jgi:hypothetical protein
MKTRLGGLRKGNYAVYVKEKYANAGCRAKANIGSYRLIMGNKDAVMAQENA